MKRLTGIALASLVLIGGLAASASAQTNRHHYYGGVNSRERYQQRRIAQGARSGELTARETYRLERRQAQIRRQEARFRRSGNGLSTRERARLQRELNHSSRSIYRQKHDRQEYRRRP